MEDLNSELQFAQTELRPPDDVMRLKRMGAFFPTRLSFMRSLIRQMVKEQPTLTRPVWEINDQGFGRAVYTIDYGGHTYSLIAFSNDLDPTNRTDRVIAEAWDTAFVLFDGIPTTDDLDRNQQNAPLQEAGRFTSKELVLSRANKSVRFFEHTAQALAEGDQPDTKMVEEIGYLMRTTAVYGNGKFGIADRAKIQNRDAMSGPFQAEMLTVWMIRNFSHDLVEHVARARSSNAVPLANNIKRHLGIGNSTGLGMAPFLVNHPILLNNWMMVRETALARVRAETRIDKERADALIKRAAKHLSEWNVPDPIQMKRIDQLRDDWAELHRGDGWMGRTHPWDALFEASQAFDLECQELTVALMLEANGPLIDGLCDCMSNSQAPILHSAMPTSKLRVLVQTQAQWALEPDFSNPAETAQFWYVSEEKLEPRLGDRHNEPGSDRESPLDIARQIQRMNGDLETAEHPTVAEFLMAFPEHRTAARRVQSLEVFPYAEIRDNLISERCLPIDMLRCKLSFFGASKFDPKSDRWTRITLYQGAPLPFELKEEADDWWLPCFAP